MPGPYYSDRIHKIRREHTLENLKIEFLGIIDYFQDNNYFLEAMGYRCVDGNDYLGLWRSYGEADKINHVIKRETGLENIWPLNNSINGLSEIELLTLIEFFYDNISFPSDLSYHNWNKCGYHINDLTTFDKSKAKKQYAAEINEVLKRYKNYILDESSGWILNQTNHIDLLIQDTDYTLDPDNNIDRAIKKFSHFDSKVEDKKEAVRILVDELEFLKRRNITPHKKDSKDLFNIINNFDMRHKNEFQQGDYDKEEFYEWMFFTFLASINLSNKLKNKQ